MKKIFTLLLAVILAAILSIVTLKFTTELFGCVSILVFGAYLLSIVFIFTSIDKLRCNKELKYHWLGIVLGIDVLIMFSSFFFAFFANLIEPIKTIVGIICIITFMIFLVFGAILIRIEEKMKIQE